MGDEIARVSWQRAKGPYFYGLTESGDMTLEYGLDLGLADFPEVRMGLQISAADIPALRRALEAFETMPGLLAAKPPEQGAH